MDCYWTCRLVQVFFRLMFSGRVLLRVFWNITQEFCEMESLLDSTHVLLVFFAILLLNKSALQALHRKIAYIGLYHFLNAFIIYSKREAKSVLLLDSGLFHSLARYDPNAFLLFLPILDALFVSATVHKALRDLNPVHFSKGNWRYQVLEALFFGI